LLFYPPSENPRVGSSILSPATSNMDKSKAAWGGLFVFDINFAFPA